jgi:hypothetical protein
VKPSRARGLPPAAELPPSKPGAQLLDELARDFLLSSETLTLARVRDMLSRAYAIGSRECWTTFSNDTYPADAR